MSRYIKCKRDSADIKLRISSIYTYNICIFIIGGTVVARLRKAKKLILLTGGGELVAYDGD
jgi:hypothetical protein